MRADKGVSRVFSAVIVDDERYSIIDMLHTFPWEKYGFQVVASYTDSQEALAAIGALEPDFLFTDIRMPGLDGLQLIERVQAMHIKTKFVITSSYSDFQYAQQAIRSGVLDYCLKPLDEDSANQLLQRLSAGAAPSERRQGEDALSGQVLAYLQANLHRPVSLSDLCREFHISTTTCCNLFSRMDTTFSAWLLEKRMAYAKRLLEGDAYPVKEIAEMCGVKDYAYFSKQFKRVYGLPPAAYRSQARRGV